MPIALGLGAAAPVAFFLIWDVLSGHGCGPPGNTSSGHVFAAAPFVLPALALVIVLIVGSMLRWRVWIVLTALFTTLAIAGVGEIVVLFIQFAAHNCAE